MTLLQRLEDQVREVTNDLDFADDITLLENSLEEAQVQLSRTAAEAEKIAGPSHQHQENRVHGQYQLQEILTLNNENIKLANDFTYLGSKMASSESDVKRHLNLACLHSGS